MKTIKDILKADSYEQRRRIAKNLAISREDKNALITNESNGGETDDDLIYYKTTRTQEPNIQNVVVLSSILPIVKYIATNPDSSYFVEVFTPQRMLFTSYGDGRFLAGFACSKRFTSYFLENELLINSAGTVEERIDSIKNSLIAAGISNEDAINYTNAWLTQFNEICSECTKEEYEAMITIKPN